MSSLTVSGWMSRQIVRPVVLLVDRDAAALAPGARRAGHRAGPRRRRLRAEQLGGRPLRLPVVFFPDGRQRVAPSLRELAAAVGEGSAVLYGVHRYLRTV